jgi:PAS domain-containing protein
VLELASFRNFDSREKALLDELLPVAAMSLEVLQRNLRAQELLAHTQEQARQLEKQTEELTLSQEELLAQQAELTEQREQLEESEERSRLLLESSAEGIFGTDTAGRITFVNPAACRMLGFTTQDGPTAASIRRKNVRCSQPTRKGKRAGLQTNYSGVRTAPECRSNMAPHQL